MELLALIISMFVVIVMVKIVVAIVVGIARLFFALIKFWLFALFFAFIICIPAIVSDNRGRTSRPDQTVSSVSTIATQSSDQNVWISLIVVVLILIFLVTWFFVHRASKKSETAKNSSQGHASVPNALTYSAAQPKSPMTPVRVSAARPLAAASPKSQTKKARNVLVVDEVEREFFRAFRLNNPWISVDVPRKFSESFLAQCQWLQDKTNKVPGLVDQIAILRDVSTGWFWDERQ